VGKNVRTRALRQHAAIESLLTDANQQPLEFYASRPSAQTATNTPAASDDVLLRESASCAALTAPSTAACSNELLELFYKFASVVCQIPDIQHALCKHYLKVLCFFCTSENKTKPLRKNLVWCVKFLNVLVLTLCSKLPNKASKKESQSLV